MSSDCTRSIQEGQALGNDENAIALATEKWRIYHHKKSHEVEPHTVEKTRLISAMLARAEQGPTFSWIMEGKTILPDPSVQLSTVLSAANAYVPAVSLWPQQELCINVGAAAWRYSPLMCIVRLIMLTSSL